MASDLTCDVGDAVTLSTVFSVAGVATDPTAVSLEVKNPAGKVTTYTDATKTATGAYKRQLSINKAGTWNYSWIGTGAAEGVGQGTITALARKSAA